MFLIMGVYQCLFVSVFIVWCIVFRTARCKEFWEMTNLSAVTHFEGIDEYYIARQREEPDDLPEEPTDPKERARIKKKLCERILTSHFFKMHGLDWLDTDLKTIREELKTDAYKNALFTIFNEYEYENRLLSTTGYGYDYRNAYRQLQFQASRTHANHRVEGIEFVFLCLARDRLSRKIKEYWVSRVYDVNLIAFAAYSIGARFIFSLDNSDIVAMAEEAAIGWRFVGVSKLATLHYALNKQNEKLSETSNQEPICSLLPAEKLRVCSALFGASEFRNKLQFSPLVENVLLGCERKTVSVGLFRRVVRRQRFEEWVIGCVASTKSNRRVTFYVSRGVEKNTVFMYREDANRRRLHVYNYYINIAVVDALTIDEEDSTEDEEDRTEDGEEERYLEQDVEN